MCQARFGSGSGSPSRFGSGWLSPRLTHSHTQTRTPPTALGARPPPRGHPHLAPFVLTPGPRSPRCPTRRCVKPGAAEPRSLSVRVLRAAVLSGGGGGGGPELGQRFCPGVGAGGD